MFGPISAIFSPDFVRNMTIIAPIDTGAWEGECNSTYGMPGHNPATDPTTCARHKNASSYSETIQRLIEHLQINVFVGC